MQAPLAPNSENNKRDRDLLALPSVASYLAMPHHIPMTFCVGLLFLAMVPDARDEMMINLPPDCLPLRCGTRKDQRGVYAFFGKQVCEGGATGWPLFPRQRLLEGNSMVKGSKNVTMGKGVVRRLSLQPADVSLQVSLQNPVWQPVKGTNEEK